MMNGVASPANILVLRSMMPDTMMAMTPRK